VGPSGSDLFAIAGGESGALAVLSQKTKKPPKAGKKLRKYKPRQAPQPLTPFEFVDIFAQG
jgi:hypothetical protein